MAVARVHCAAGRIKFQMELFNLHIQQGRDLCAKLSSVASVIKTPPAQLQSQLAIEVVSPILAKCARTGLDRTGHGGLLRACSLL